MNESPFGFNVNEGTTLPVINAYIGQYATPEAAAADTMEYAPQGYEYLKEQYQRLTGDSFADPFEDASRARTGQITDAIQLGKLGLGPQIGTSTGQFGTTVSRPSLLDTLRFSGTPQPAGPVGDALGAVGAPSRAGLLGGIGAKTGEGIGGTGLLSGGGLINATLQSAILSHPEFQLPDVGGSYTDIEGQTSNYADIQKRRAAALGVTDIFDTLTKNNPDALKPVDTTSPLLQVDEKGRPIAGDVLNAKLFNDPEFQRTLKFQPKKAAALYKAIFDRDLAQDIGGQVEANVERTKTADKVLDALDKGLDFDDITGEPYIRVMKSDPFNPGQEIEARRPLSAPEKVALEQKGGYESRYGAPRPQGMNVTPDEANTLRSKRDEILAKNPNLPKAIALLQARKELATSAKLGSAGGGKLTQAADFFDKLSGAVINTGIDQTNRLFQGAGITEGPLYPMMRGGIGTQIGEAASSAVDVGTSIFDWLREETGPQGSFPIQ